MNIDGLCPYCQKYVGFGSIPLWKPGASSFDCSSELYKNKTGLWGLFECPSCKRCVIVGRFSDNKDNPQMQHVYPMPLPSPVDQRIPEKIRRDITEAKLCFSVGAFNASASMSRRALQRACREKGAAKEKLIDQIDELAQNGIITHDLKELAHAIRMVGNDGAHPNEFDVNEQDSKEILELADQFMSVIFVAPARVKEISGKRTLVKK